MQSLNTTTRTHPGEIEPIDYNPRVSTGPSISRKADLADLIDRDLQLQLQRTDMSITHVSLMAKIDELTEFLRFEKQ